ncbi:peptidemethionine sulfoxide reductase 3 [Actinidia rufa]|uniref:peptide-methionine (S)-S-oxide reductase n=1 Tax=Actinidia rufa TaxID=165716 RepID=A0A7J0EB91_9ERIC|nr:peptidemethionine sulfoxide reductase 3 [Actinidia rufa]
MNWLAKLGLGARSPTGRSVNPASSEIARDPDDGFPVPENQFAQFGAGCFWGYDPNKTMFDLAIWLVNCGGFWSDCCKIEVGFASCGSAYVGNDVGTQYRSGIYFYTPEQEKAALESRDRQQQLLNRKIVTEILPAKKFYRAEEYHQQYLEKGGRFGFKQSANKGCNDPIRCYG